MYLYIYIYVGWLLFIFSSGITPSKMTTTDLQHPSTIWPRICASVDGFSTFGFSWKSGCNLSQTTVRTHSESYALSISRAFLKILGTQKLDGLCWKTHLYKCFLFWVPPFHGSLNVPIEHHPTIRYMVYNGYYKGMSNSPKMGQLPTPAFMDTSIELFHWHRPSPPHGRPVDGATSSPAPKKTRKKQDLGIESSNMGGRWIKQVPSGYD